MYVNTNLQHFWIFIDISCFLLFLCTSIPNNWISPLTVGRGKPGGNFSMQKLFVDIWSVRSIPSLHVLYHSLEITETYFFYSAQAFSLFSFSYEKMTLVLRQNMTLNQFLGDPSLALSWSLGHIRMMLILDWCDPCGWRFWVHATSPC